MEHYIVLLIPAVLSYILVRCLLYPMQWIWKAAIHCLCGFACLWLVNTASGFTGICLPVNAVTVAIAGLLGVPGIGVITLLQLM